MAMKAAVLRRYGSADAISIEDREMPLPARGEVQVRVQAASLNPLDLKIMSGALRWRVRAAPPRGLGIDFAGLISAIGEDVTSWRVGEAVFGSLDPWQRQGAFAEVITAAANAVTRKPANVSFEAAAALSVAGGTAVQALWDHVQAKSERSKRLLLIGASGGVGTYALQLAHHFKWEVTGVCSKRHGEHVRDFGARHIVSYDHEDVCSLPEAYDLVFDAAGAVPFSRCRHLLAAGGVYLTTAVSMGAVLKSWTGALGARSRARAVMFNRTLETLDDLAALSAKGILRTTIDTLTPLADLPNLVRDAQRSTVAGKRIVMIR
jgi:NADPH:quinone reductase-like Zn-dependent oxidoreductase